MKEKGTRWRCALAGSAAGVATGLFGGGGGMVLVPLLLGFCRVEEKKAFASSVAIILPMCVVSAVVTFWGKEVPWMEALPYLVGGLIGGWLGGRFFKKVSVGFLRKALALVLVYGGVKCLFF